MATTRDGQEIEVKWQCEQCGELHDTQTLAETCCPPDVWKFYICPKCNEKYSTEEEAINCCDADIDHSDPRKYPRATPLTPPEKYVAQFIEMNHYRG